MVFFQTMILTIETDVIDAVESSDAVALDVLRQCAIAIGRGKHIVEIKFSDVVRLFKIKDKFSRQELSAFDKAKSKYAQLGRLKKLMCIRCVITFKHKTKKDKDVIYINPNENRDFEFLEETHLLVENIEDAFFFKYLSDNFQRKGKTLYCGVSSYKLMGGGDTTSKVLEYEIDLKQHFVLAIADSDKHYLNDPYLGETASKIKHNLLLNPFNCDLYYMKEVREIENLIPFKYICCNPNFKSHVVVTDKIGFNRSFFDMKDGVHYSSLFTDEGYNYWNSQLNHLVEAKTFAEINIDRKSLSKEDYRSKYKGKKLFDAFGGQVLAQSLEQMKEDRYLVTDADLTKEQQHEWENIGKVITSWCCCFAKQRL